MIIDSHAHIYLPEFEEDLDAIIEKAKNHGVHQIYMPNIDSSTIHQMHAVEKKFPQCKSMMGLHPCYVKENYKEELNTIESHLQKRDYAAVGEIGIDLYWDKTFVKEQEFAFSYQIGLAKEHNLSFIIHSRDSLDRTIQMVADRQDGSLNGIFHCFNGTVDQGKKIIDLGFYLGIGGVVTYKNAGVDKVVAQLPLSSMVLETDSPYLSPGPKRIKRNEPSRLSLVIDKMEVLLDEDRETIERITSQNCKKIFFY
ncbi:MAG: TatD family hydrolase [Saprospiraceae bacterium]|nr:TatD family hydrolase [Saprospiraceae bacterium]